MTDEAIQNQEGGNGILMGVKVPLSTDRLDSFLNVVLEVIRYKLQVEFTAHATKRLAEDRLRGPEDPEFRGWTNKHDVYNAVRTIKQLNSARLTVDKSSIGTSNLYFNPSLAFEVCGIKPNGEEGTLALALIDDGIITIITLL